MLSETKPCFQSTFNVEICSILIEIMSMNDAFLKFSLLNKNFHKVMEKLKKFTKLWKMKFLQEFISAKDKQDGHYIKQEDQDRYFNVFKDHQLGPDQTTYEFFKSAINKQLVIRNLIYHIIKETNEQMYKGKVKADNPNAQPQGIMNFIRDFDKRHEFSWRASGLPEDITLDIYIFFRAFHNPDLEGFS